MAQAGMSPAQPRDHGGGIDAAMAEFGGTRGDWLDLSTGINPLPYPVSAPSALAWTALPDRDAQQRLIAAARRFWQVPNDVAILAAPGASALIARLPLLAPPGRVIIPGPTYNEHAAAFANAGWTVCDADAGAGAEHAARVIVHPNNPTGHLYRDEHPIEGLHVIDESFCDVMPDQSLMDLACGDMTVVLKSFGKFWGLAGLRLGFAMGQPALIERLAQMLGPWPVSGPALEIGRAALQDAQWAADTRERLTQDAARLDRLMTGAGATLCGGTTLFRLYEVGDAEAWQRRLATHHVWTRIFPYSDRLIRLGLPAPDRWAQLEAAL